MVYCMQEPKTLKPACILLSISLGVYLLAGIIPAILVHGDWSRFCLYFLPVKALIYAFLIWQVWGGQNWARIVMVFIYLMTLMYALCFAFLAHSFPEIMQVMSTPENPPPDDLVRFFSQNHPAILISIVLMSVEKTIEAIAVFLLFSETSNAFFSKTNQV